MDSIRKEVLEYYLIKVTYFTSTTSSTDLLDGDLQFFLKIYTWSSFCLQGTQVVDESQDQDTTDLHKCIKYIRATTPDEEIPNVSKK